MFLLLFLNTLHFLQILNLLLSSEVLRNLDVLLPIRLADTIQIIPLVLTQTRCLLASIPLTRRPRESQFLLLLLLQKGLVILVYVRDREGVLVAGNRSNGVARHHVLAQSNYFIFCQVCHQLLGGLLDFNELVQ